MISVAAGLAHAGAEVFCYSLGNFPTMRPLDQLRNLVIYHNLNVNIVSSGCGFSYGQLGYTHHALEDVGIVSSLPNIRIFSPSSVGEMALCFDEMMKTSGPTYLRLDRSYRKAPEPMECQSHQFMDLDICRVQAYWCLCLRRYGW